MILPATLAVKQYLGLSGDLIAQLSVKSYPYPVMRAAFIRLPHVANKYLRFGVNAAHIQLKLVEHFLVGTIILWRQR